MKQQKEPFALALIGIAVLAAIFLKAWSMGALQASRPAPAPIAQADTRPAAPAPAPAGIVRTAYDPASPLTEYLNPHTLYLRSGAALVMDERTGAVLFEQDSDAQRPIASLTKLMTAVVILDARLPMDQPITITRADRDWLRGSSSRLAYGTTLTRYDMLHVALAASDNRAAAALARTYPGGSEAAVAAMNAKARELGMTRTFYADPTGLNSRNVSTAQDLAKLIVATGHYALIHRFTTTGTFRVRDARTGRLLAFLNTNRLVRRESWDIELSKTGYTSDAGNCLVMETTIARRPLIIVLLDSWGKLTKFADANRIRTWLLRAEHRAANVELAKTNIQS